MVLELKAPKMMDTGTSKQQLVRYCISSIALWHSGGIGAAIFGEDLDSNHKWQAANNQQASAAAPKLF